MHSILFIGWVGLHLLQQGHLEWYDHCIIGDHFPSEKPRTISDDLVDYVKPVVRKKPENLIVHIDTNDLQKEITLKKICDITTNKFPKTKITLSLNTVCKDDQKLSQATKTMIELLRKFTTKISYFLLRIKTSMKHSQVKANYT